LCEKVLVKNPNLGQKIEILAKIQHFCQKLNFAQKSKFSSESVQQNKNNPSGFYPQ